MCILLYYHTKYCIVNSAYFFDHRIICLMRIIIYNFFIFFEFDQYVEIKISMQNISWFIYYHLYLFLDLLIEFHFLITIICLYFLFIYSLNLTFRSSEYKDTKIHIFHSFLYGDKLVSDNGVDLTIFIFRFS